MELRKVKVNKMNKHVLACMVMLFSMTTSADEKIERAIDDVLRFSCLSDWATAHAVPEFGVPDELLAEPSFTSLVEVVRSRIDHCDVHFACGITNDVRSAVFIAALTGCGANVYTNAVVRWFGGDNPADASPRRMMEYAFPAATRLEGYLTLHYEEPEIKKVWQNIKAASLATNDASYAAWADRVLSGEAKEWIEMMERFEKEGAGKK